MSTSVRISAIIPMEELDAMGRRRYQQPSILKTTGKRPMWYFRARVDTITARDGARSISRPEERYYLGYCDEMTKLDAKRRRDEMLAEVINRPQVLIPSQVKFAEVLKIYRRDHLPNLRETTRETQEGIIRTHIEPPLGNLRMCDIDALAIQRWLTGMNLAYKTKEAYLGLLRVIWSRAGDWGYTQQRFPVRKGGVTLGPKRGVKGTQMATIDQLRRLLAALEDPFRAMAEIALYCGLRISEIRGLKWADIADGQLVVERRVSSKDDVDVLKSGGARVFDLRPLAAVFSRLKREGEWVFFQAGAGYDNCQLRMARAREAAGITIPRFSWHHLRAAFNTLARAYGADAADRQALMGHTTEAMNAVYLHAAPGDVRRRGDLMLAVQQAILGETKGVQ